MAAVLAAGVVAGGPGTAAAQRGVTADQVPPIAAPSPAVAQPPAVPAIRVVPLPGTIALTFDDGPDPTWTPVILDILAEHGAVATFFVTGRKVDANPELAARIVAEGHSLQNHAYYHNALNRRSDASIAFHIDAGDAAIYAATGTHPVCLRPPGGKTSSRVAAVAAAHGHRIVLWSGDSGDYAHRSREGVLRRAATWGAGDVALMHDNWGFIHRYTLGPILDDLSSRGIGFSTICVPAHILVSPGVE